MWEAVIKILHFTDPHFCTVGPISRTDDYTETIFRKLDEIRSIDKKEQCDFITISGDFFHLKPWYKNPYSLTNRLIDYFNSLDAKVYGIFGDHDVPDRQQDSLKKQPLSTLVKSAGIYLISKGEKVPLGEDVWLTGSPKTND